MIIQINDNTQCVQFLLFSCSCSVSFFHTLILLYSFSIFLSYFIHFLSSFIFFPSSSFLSFPPCFPYFLPLPFFSSIHPSFQFLSSILTTSRHSSVKDPKTQRLLTERTSLQNDVRLATLQRITLEFDLAQCPRRSFRRHEDDVNLIGILKRPERG